MDESTRGSEIRAARRKKNSKEKRSALQERSEVATEKGLLHGELEVERQQDLLL